jgi:branched-subunit amino acid ABC-type transport system permease component
MVYGIIGMINFAHGDVFMVGGFIALIAFLTLLAIGITSIPLALFLVLLIAMTLTALYGWTVERIAYRPLRHSYRLAPLISAIGMSIILQNYVQIAQGRPRQAAAADHHRRPPADVERGLRCRHLQHPDHRRACHAGADAGVLLAGGEDPASAATCAPASRI